MSPSADARSGLRVGYVLKKYPRLSETFILDEILALEAAGAHVSIFSLRLPDDGRFHHELARVAAPVRYLPAFGSSSALSAFRTLSELGPGGTFRLERALRFVDRLPEGVRTPLLVQALHLADAARAERVDHLHAHFMTVAAHATYLAHLLTGIPFTVTSHAKDIYRDGVDPGVYSEVAAAARALVTVCGANRSYIREKLLTSPGPRVEVVYNGIPLEDIRPNGAPRDPRLLLAVGRLVEKKGYHILLQACRLLLDRGIDFRCVIVGDGDQRPRLEADRARLGLEDHVHMGGSVPRAAILERMARARVLVAPCVTGTDGNRDALPTVALEALALGLPVVSTPVGGIPEIFDHEGQGLFVPEGDPVALAAALERLLGDGALWTRLSRSGRERAESRFDRRKNLPRLLELFSAGGRQASLARASA